MLPQVLQVLKDRVYQRGLASVSNMLEIHDLNRSGYLSLDSFQKAMEAELNMKVPPFVTGASRCRLSRNNHTGSCQSIRVHVDNNRRNANSNRC